MKKTLLLSFLLMIFTLSAISQNRKIIFSEKTWQENLALSKEQNKMIFLDAFASWCGPCKWMAKNMFTNDTVADYYNREFICVSMDMEKGEGIALAKKFNIRVYPTLLFIDANGEILHRKAGAPQHAGDYIAIGETAKNPDLRFSSLEKKYKSGNNSPELVSAYITALAETYLPYNDVLTKYFSTQNEKDLTNRANWNMISKFVSDPESVQFKYLITHQDKYAALYGADSIQSKIASVYADQLYGMMRNPKMNDSIFDVAKAKVLAVGFKGADQVIFNAELTYYQQRMKTAKFLNLVYNDLDKYYSNDPDVLNNIAWSVVNAATDEKFLLKAIEWSKRSIELKKDPTFLDTYAVLLLKTGKTAEAIKQEQAAIDLAKQLGQPTSQFEEKLKTMQK